MRHNISVDETDAARLRPLLLSLSQEKSREADEEPFYGERTAEQQLGIEKDSAVLLWLWHKLGGRA
jgi:hypothetical protein